MSGFSSKLRDDVFLFWTAAEVEPMERNYFGRDSFLIRKIMLMKIVLDCSESVSSCCFWCKVSNEKEFETKN